MMLGFILEKRHIRASTKHSKCGISQSHSFRCGDNPFLVFYDSEETELYSTYEEYTEVILEVIQWELLDIEFSNMRRQHSDSPNPYVDAVISFSIDGAYGLNSKIKWHVFNTQLSIPIIFN